jgi:hypothetical protein
MSFVDGHVGIIFLHADNLWIDSTPFFCAKVVQKSVTIDRTASLALNIVKQLRSLTLALPFLD